MEWRILEDFENGGLWSGGCRRILKMEDCGVEDFDGLWSRGFWRILKVEDCGMDFFGGFRKWRFMEWRFLEVFKMEVFGRWRLGPPLIFGSNCCLKYYGITKVFKHFVKKVLLSLGFYGPSFQKCVEI